MSKYASEEEVIKNISKEEAKKIVWDEVRDLGYKEGLEKAWEAVKRIMLSKKDGGLSSDECENVFGKSSLYELLEYGMTVYDVIEALDKYDEWNEIHVGDEYVARGTDLRTVVTKVEQDHVWHLYGNATYSCEKKTVFLDRFKKTGNHFAEVSKLLEKLRGGETE